MTQLPSLQTRTCWDTRFYSSFTGDNSYSQYWYVMCLCATSKTFNGIVNVSDDCLTFTPDMWNVWMPFNHNVVQSPATAAWNVGNKFGEGATVRTEPENDCGRMSMAGYVKYAAMQSICSESPNRCGPQLWRIWICLTDETSKTEPCADW